MQRSYPSDSDSAEAQSQTKQWVRRTQAGLLILGFAAIAAGDRWGDRALIDGGLALLGVALLVWGSLTLMGSRFGFVAGSSSRDEQYASFSAFCWGNIQLMAALGLITFAYYRLRGAEAVLAQKALAGPGPFILLAGIMIVFWGGAVMFTRHGGGGPKLAAELASSLRFVFGGAITAVGLAVIIAGVVALFAPAELNHALTILKSHLLSIASDLAGL